MTIDISLYEASKKRIVSWYESHGNGDIKGSIGFLASSYSVPAIVVAYWLGELSNWHPDIVKSIVTIRDFYGYTSIINKPEGSPI